MMRLKSLNEDRLKRKVDLPVSGAPPGGYVDK